ncbi:TVP38/TMEM64 family protein [Salinisphaera sp. Q1T1-3]|uniref:TVP38/TMEM64 family protein n=1 Tax=Salinisphaera sp. Q1T1-3 TaxID=2321229 RepID=UPI000E763163|nr:VTT domain-containing protein [Salinisphaera sp. Q1T1-3]RJS93118.1 TVP38/TMEM64 family protein [Salinisphaera sp. Q1T1-3]
MSHTLKRRTKLRIIAGSVWAVLFGALVCWVLAQGLSVREIMALIYHYVVDNPIAPLVYIIIYALRPLTFFPAMWLTIAGGSLFGFVPGLIFGLLGENASAQTAYLLARFFRTDMDGDGESDRNPKIAAFRRLLTEQAFPTVLVLRASFLPFDLVNYACGLLRVPWPSYTAGSVIGMLPPMITFVSFGATVNLPKLLKQQSFSPEQLIDGKQLAISGGLLVASAIIAYFAHRRRKRLAAGSAPDTN